MALALALAALSPASADAQPARPPSPRDTARVAEVVVTAARTEEALARVPTSVSVVGPEDIASRGFVRLDDVLRTVPGVTLAENQVSIRGSSGFSYSAGSRVLLLVDGVPMLGPDAEGIPFEALPLDQVARVEVVKGPGSALYGSGALGGVVHLITRRAPETPTTAISAMAGAYTPVRHRAWRDAWPDGGSELRPFATLSLSHSRTIGERTEGWATVHGRLDRGYLDRGAAGRVLAYAKVRHQLGGAMRRARVEVLGGGTFSRADNFLYWDGLASPLRPGTLALGGGQATGSSDAQTFRYALLPSFVMALPRATVVTARARLFGVVTVPIDADGRPFPLANGTVGVRYGGEVQLARATAAGLLTAGASADANATRASIYAEDRYRGQPEGAVFAQLDARPLPRLRVTPGLRVDAYRLSTDRTERQVSPKLSVGFDAAPDVHLRAAAGAGFRVPGVTERFVDDSQFLPLIPNVDLRPETSRGVEAGIRAARAFGRGPHRGGAMAPRLRLDVALFQTDYRRLVEPRFVTVGARSGFQFVNLTRARIRGVEAGLTGEARVLGRAASAGVAYTLLDARDLETDAPLVYRNRHLVQAQASLALTRTVTLGADARYASRPENVDSDFARFVPDADVFTDVRVLDVRAAWTTRAGQWSLIGRNVLDHYHTERPAYLSPVRSVALQWRAAF